jgi:hypothetical protein
MNTTSTNPGTVDPSRQCFPPPPQQAQVPSSAPLRSSNGENQFPAVRQAAAAPASGTGLPAEVRPSNDCCARPLATSVASPSPRGLPAEVSPGCCTRPTVTDVATPTSTPRDVRADAGRPGGLPVNVCIR